MTAVFADTFYWIALADSTDNSHRRALELTAKLTDVAIVTTDEVLVEYLTFFATAHERMRRKALINAQRILEAPDVYVVPQSRDSLLSGMALYEARPDKGYSLTDCISDLRSGLIVNNPSMCNTSRRSPINPVGRTLKLLT